MPEATANVRVDPDVRERSNARGREGGTYSEIVDRLLDATDGGEP